MSIIPGNYLIYTANFGRRLNLSGSSAQFNTVPASNPVAPSQQIQVASVPGRAGFYNLAVPSASGNNKAGNNGSVAEGTQLTGQATAKAYEFFQGAVTDHRFQIQDGGFAWTLAANNNVALNTTTGTDGQLWIFVALSL